MNCFTVGGGLGKRETSPFGSEDSLILILTKGMTPYLLMEIVLPVQNLYVDQALYRRDLCGGTK